jgi:hypothetical protein
MPEGKTRLAVLLLIGGMLAPAFQPPPLTAEYKKKTLQVTGLWKSGLSGRKGQLAKSQGTWSQGDTRSTWVAYRDKGELVLIEEQLHSGPDGAGERSSRSYYYLNNALALFEADKKVRTLAVKPGPERRVQIEIAFDLHGRPVASEKKVDGAKSTVSKAEIQEALTHGKALFASAAGTK